MRIDFASRFLRDGYVINNVESTVSLRFIRTIIDDAMARQNTWLARGVDLNDIHDHVTVEGLNAFRLGLIQALDRDEVRRAYYRIAASAIDEIVGNELAMQRRINLSIQFPDDASSLLPLHCDTWNGDSAYEVVLWVPLVDCHDTKSMYIIPGVHPPGVLPPEQTFQIYLARTKFLTVDYGQYLLFTPTLMHGNRVNETKETRWSMNCRFKGLFTPFAEKRLGEFFVPHHIKPATRIGMKYKLPKVKA